MGDFVMATQTLEPSEVVDLLFRKYDLLKRDVLLHMQHFKNHVRNFQILFTLIIASGSYFFFRDEFKPSDNNKYFWLTFIFAVVNLSFFLLYDVLHASFQIAVDSERMATLEREINEVIDEDLLLWESKLVVLLHTDLFNPQFYLIFYAFVLFVLSVLVIPGFVIYKLWKLVPVDAVFQACSQFTFFYSLGSFVVAIVVGVYVGIILKPKAATKIQEVISSKRKARRNSERAEPTAK
jgi:hypothetical protein